MLKDVKYIFNQDKSLLEALKKINDLQQNPLVLFVVDNDGKMVGTLTDGDARRAIVKGAKLSDPIFSVMNSEFNYILENNGDIVYEIYCQRKLKMRLVPVLDKNHHIVEIINLEKYVTQLPIDAVIMAGALVAIV